MADLAKLLGRDVPRNLARARTAQVEAARRDRDLRDVTETLIGVFVGKLNDSKRRLMEIAIMLETKNDTAARAEIAKLASELGDVVRSAAEAAA